MLMEFAEVRLRSPRSGSAKACLTSAWQLSNLLSSAIVAMLPPRVVICRRCRSETS